MPSNVTWGWQSSGSLLTVTWQEMRRLPDLPKCMLSIFAKPGSRFKQQNQEVSTPSQKPRLWSSGTRRLERPALHLTTRYSTCSAPSRSASSNYSLATVDCVPTYTALVCHTVSCLRQTGPQTPDHLLQSYPYTWKRRHSTGPKAPHWQRSFGALKRTWYRQQFISSSKLDVWGLSYKLLLMKNWREHQNNGHLWNKDVYLARDNE